MAVALDLANWFSNVADTIQDEHKRQLGKRPPDGSPDLPPWQDNLNTLTNQYSTLNGAQMALANLDAEQTLESLGQSLKEVTVATKDARDAIAHIADINKALKLVAALVGVAAAIPAVIADPVAGAGGLYAAGDALVKALKSLDDGGNGGGNTGGAAAPAAV